MVKTPQQLVEKLKEVFKEDLFSVILYGSSVTGEFVEKISDYNILIILSKIDFNSLNKLNKIIKKWFNYGNPVPLIFTVENFYKSIDVFPIEFLDIKNSHKILYGQDVLKDLKVELENLRIELEKELKENYLKLIQHYILYSNNKKLLRDLLLKSSSTFFSLFRAILRLLNQQPPLKKTDSAKLLLEKFGFEKELVYKIELLKENQKIDIENTFEKYVRLIEAVIKKIDEYKFYKKED